MTIRRVYPFSWILVLSAGTLSSVSQTVTLSFQPPAHAVVQISRERTISTVTRQTADFDNEKTVLLMGFEATPGGYQVIEVAKEMSRTINGKPFDNPAHKFLIGRTNALIFSSGGEFIRLEGQERQLDELKAFFPTNAHALLECLYG